MILLKTSSDIRMGRPICYTKLKSLTFIWDSFWVGTGQVIVVGDDELFTKSISSIVCLIKYEESMIY